MGWFRLPDVFDSPEFTALSAEVRSYLSQPTIPTAEILTHIPPTVPGIEPSLQYLLLAAIGQIPQSQGTVKLASTDPNVAPLSDPAFLSHPFDQRATISSIRHIMQLVESPALKSRILMPLSLPKSTSEEDILTFARETMSTTYHPSCSVKMGKSDDAMACLDTDFRVRGTQNLRVADLSSLPLLPNCHPQSVAYLIGLTAAEKIIAGHGFTI